LDSERTGKTDNGADSNQTRVGPSSSLAGIHARRNYLRALSLALFAIGFVGAVIIFTDVQVMNGVYHVGSVTYSASGYPWWTERVTEQLCFVGARPGDNCGFINYGQALGLSLLASFVGFLTWLFLNTTGPRRRLLHAVGLSLMMYGLLIAATVFIEVQVFNGVYRAGDLTLSFQGFPGGGQEVLGSSCLVGSDQYHCPFFSYDELLYLSSGLAFVGLILWGYSQITEASL
jgi:hypothetical protein